jgi:ERCC4-type nuclease
MYRGRGRGGARTMVQGGPRGSVARKPTAKCSANQEAVDKLHELVEQESANPNSNYVFVVKRALKSVVECKTPITTLKEATELKHVGPKMARIIVPTSSSNIASVSSPPPLKAAAATSKKTKNGSIATVPTESLSAVAAAPVSCPERRLKQSTLSSSLTVSSSSCSATTATKKERVISAKQMAYDKAALEAENLILPTNASWKVILLVDGREHKSKHVVSKCQQSGIPCEERHLPIGDAAWVARCTIPSKDKTGDPNKPPAMTILEVMCGTILERKEISDFSSSLFGTRYNEQRLRLQNCGIPQVLFLVEGELNSSVNCPPETLHMAMMETRVQLGFQVVQTKHLEDTVRLLKGLHRRIVQRTFPQAFSSLQNEDPLPTYRSPQDGDILRNGARGSRRQRRPTSLLEMVFDTPPVPPLGSSRFITYPELKAKVIRDREAGTRTVGAIYLAMLKQVPTLSQKKCHAIAREYPTWDSLMTAYAKSSHTDSNGVDPALLVRDVECERQKVGPKSSQELFVACCTDRYGKLPSSGPSRSKSSSAELATTKKKPTSRDSGPGKTVPNKGNLKDPPKPTSPERMTHTNVTESSPDSTTACFDATKSPTPHHQQSSNCVDLTTPVSKHVPVAQAPITAKATTTPHCATAAERRMTGQQLSRHSASSPSSTASATPEKYQCTGPRRISQQAPGGRPTMAKVSFSSSSTSSHNGSPPLFESPSSCDLSSDNRSSPLNGNGSHTDAKLPAKRSLSISFVSDVLDLCQNDSNDDDSQPESQHKEAAKKSQDTKSSSSIVVIDSSDEDIDYGLWNEHRKRAPKALPKALSSSNEQPTIAAVAAARSVSNESSTSSASGETHRTTAMASKRAILEYWQLSSSDEDASPFNDNTRHTKRPKVSSSTKEVELIEID